MDGFGHTFGDVIDGRIEITLLEHWYDTLRGLEGWRQPAFFYPTPDTLGYNDGYFLLGVIYSGWRVLGVDPFLASELVNVVMRVIAFAGFLLFARSPCGLPFGWAVLGAALFTLSNAAYLQMGHAQLLTTAFAPVLGWLLWMAVSALFRREARRAAAWGCAAALLFDAWLFTAFYAAWFTAFFVLIMALSALIGWAGDRTRKSPFSMRGLSWWPVFPVLLVLAVGLVPFLMTYLPILRITGMHSVGTALALTPAPFDLISTGDGNLLYGGLNTWLQHTVWPTPDRSWEFRVGMPLLMLAFCICGIVLTWVRPPEPGRMLWRVLATSFVIAIALSVRIGDRTLWLYVYDYVPAAGVIRAVSRFVLFLWFPAALLAVYGLARCSRRLPIVVTTLITVLLVAEQINLLREDRIPRAEERQFLAAIPPVPATCKVFAVTAQRSVAPEIATPDLLSYIRNVDGMLIAEIIHVPTLNGHASFLPIDFTLASPEDTEKLVRVAAAAHNITDSVCGLDLVKMAWTEAPLPPLPTQPLALDQTILLRQPSSNAAAYLGGGWSVPEDTGRWTDGPEVQIDFAAPMPRQDLEFTLRGQPLLGPGLPSRIDVFANGHAIDVWNPKPGFQFLRATIPASLISPNGTVNLVLKIATPLRLSDLPPAPGQARSPETRQLGLWVESFVVTAASPP